MLSSNASPSDRGESESNDELVRPADTSVPEDCGSSTVGEGGGGESLTRMVLVGTLDSACAAISVRDARSVTRATVHLVPRAEEKNDTTWSDRHAWAMTEAAPRLTVCVDICSPATAQAPHTACCSAQEGSSLSGRQICRFPTLMVSPSDLWGVTRSTPSSA